MEFKIEIASQYPPCYLSYSQEGEDLILHRFFQGQQHGMYVDVGAHHPTRFSNTFIFYLRGWRGINIDAMPGCKHIFDSIRPEDCNIECAVGNDEVLPFYIFNEPALNTFDKDYADKICRDNPHYHIVEIKDIQKTPLSIILDKNMIQGAHIDFLSIDVENSDLEVARSNDWNKYRPKVVLLENHDLKGEQGLLPLREFMTSKAYKLSFRTVNTDFFVDTQTS